MRIVTSESVSRGHPDKMCDQISDAILDAILEQDKQSRVAIETLLKGNLIVIAGEVTTQAHIDYEAIAKRVIKNIGYNDAIYDINADECVVVTKIDKQSPCIAQGVNNDGAGDQGLMFGYAVRETKNYMPLPISFCQTMMKLQKDFDNKLRPDAKCQVSIAYDNEKAQYIDTIVYSNQHAELITQYALHHVMKNLINEAIGIHAKDFHQHHHFAAQPKLFLNATGSFLFGGAKADCGLTGRKIIVDTYGGACPHGGGAFSGKDPTKVDRSASYMARYIAKNILHRYPEVNSALVQIAYCIGVAKPVSVYIKTSVNPILDAHLTSEALKLVDLRPKAIIERLELLNSKKTKYLLTAQNGHFGNEDFTWEKLDLII
jgi:S-adenosylmethionine synthetase